MTVQVRFFASLKQKLTIDVTQIRHTPGMTVAQAWDLATNKAARPNNTLCSINLEYAHLDSQVDDEDEVAFFPPVTGG